MFKHRDATKYGIDIAKGRVDSLDKEVIKFAIGYKGKKVAVDLGAGESRLSAILLLLGWDIWIYDIRDNSKYCATLENLVGEGGGSVHCVQIDITNITQADLPNDIVLVVSQRTLHHLQYNKTKKLLESVRNNMIRGGKLFISISGVNSRFVDEYRCISSPVEDRFCEVGEVGKMTYSIVGNVCLYNQGEIRELVEGIGFNIESINESDFGNIRIIANK